MEQPLSFEQPSLTSAQERVRDLVDGQAIDHVLEVRAVTRRAKKNGDPFIKLQLGDASGQVEAVAWDDVEGVAAVAALGAVVRVFGSFSDDARYGRSITLRRIRLAEHGEYEPAQIYASAPIPYDQMVADLEELIGTPVYLDCWVKVLPRWRRDPAALARFGFPESAHHDKESV